MHEGAYATHQMHCQLRYGPFDGKDSVSAALVHQCYEPVTDELAVA